MARQCHCRRSVRLLLTIAIGLAYFWFQVKLFAIYQLTGDSKSNSSSGLHFDLHFESNSRNEHGNQNESEEPVLTLLVMLSGEFGNNVFKILRGWGIAQLAKRDFGLTTRIVVAEHRVPKGPRKGQILEQTKATSRQLERCFRFPSELFLDSPNTNANANANANANTTRGDASAFELGNTLLGEGYFTEITNPMVQEYINQNRNDNDSSSSPISFDLSDDGASIKDLRRYLQILSNYLRDHPQLVANHDHNNNNTAKSSHHSPNSKIPRLMVRVSSLMIYSIVDEFYDLMRATFLFDDAKCCGSTLDHPPRPHETVLHLRNYATELPKKDRWKGGYQELSTEQLVTKLLGHLRKGDELAIAGRKLAHDAQIEGTEAYNLVKALEGKDLKLRFPPADNDAMADFCFLRHTRKELIGTTKSTYLQLAAYLGKHSEATARMYQYVPPDMLKRVAQAVAVGGPKQRQTQNLRCLERFQTSVGKHWNHPELKARISLEEYYNDDEDEGG